MHWILFHFLCLPQSEAGAFHQTLHQYCRSLYFVQVLYTRISFLSVRPTKKEACILLKRYYKCELGILHTYLGIPPKSAQTISHDFAIRSSVYS